MIPLRDKNPSGIVPVIVYLLIAANAAIFLLEVAMPEEDLMEMAMRFGMVPEKITLALRGEGNIVTGLAVPSVTSMFLHGGWLHLVGNMWFLFIFGDNVEGRLGHLRFLLFYVFCGLLAGLTQYALGPTVASPMIGASGAIAGVLGAYAVCWPQARIVTLVPFFILVLVELPALVVLGFWFVIQFFKGTASLGVETAGGGVAYGAHVGGFLAGALIIWLLPRRKWRSRRPHRPS